MLLVAQKDLRLELRTKEIISTTTMFAALVVILASLSFYLNPSTAKQMAPGVLFISIAFSGILAVGRTFAREREGDALTGLLLSPIPRASIYLGKALAMFLFMSTVELILVPLVGGLFHLDLMLVIGPLLAILSSATLGFVLTGTLFGLMTTRTQARDLVLSVVVFPLVAPALLAGVVATRELLGGATMSELWGWIRILGAFDLVALALGVALFDALAAE